MALSPAKQELFNVARQKLLQDMQELFQKEIAPIYQRVGAGSPQIAAKKADIAQETTSQISQLFAQLGITQEAEEREERLIGEEREFETKLTREQWRNQYKNLLQSQSFQEKMARFSAGERERLLKMQRTWQLEDVEAQKKTVWEQILGAVPKLALGALTGGIGGALTSGISVGQGILAGGPAVAEFGMQKNVLADFFKQQQALQPVQQFLSQTTQFPDLTQTGGKIGGFGGLPESLSLDMLRRRFPQLTGRTR